MAIVFGLLSAHVEKPVNPLKRTKKELRRECRGILANENLTAEEKAKKINFAVSWHLFYSREKAIGKRRIARLTREITAGKAA